jgi:putative ABC transport system permease protein
MIFYIQYALRNLIRNRRWSLFAMFAVGAGVATIVALRTLGLSISESLTNNIRVSNKGDITLMRPTGMMGFNFGMSNDSNIFNAYQRDMIRSWATQNDGQMTEYSMYNMQISPINQPAATFGFMTGLFINPDTYPPVGDIRTIDPPNIAIRDLLTRDDVAIISDNMARTQNIAVGDWVSVAGSNKTFRVVGIVETQVEAGMRSVFAALFGFAYIHQQHLPALNFPNDFNQISITLPEGTTLEQIEAAGNNLRIVTDQMAGQTRILTVTSVLRQNELVADAISTFVVVMGLGALLIGGVGIINTMLVMIRRRTEEIAALKTFGLKGRQVATLFMVEALLLGIGGSALGGLFGILLSRITHIYGERFVMQSLTWKVYPEALLFGVTLGVVVTAVFGVIPVLTAVKVRPATILRPNEVVVPALGVLQALLVGMFVVIALGLIAGQIIGPLPEQIPFLRDFPIPLHMIAGMALVMFTLAILAILTVALWVVVWIVGKFPAFGWVDLGLALRNLTTRRLRTATTMLAISTGVFAITSISLYGAGIQQILSFALSDNFGGDVLIVSPSSFLATSEVVRQANRNYLNHQLDQIGDAVLYRTEIQSFSGQVVEANQRSLRGLDGDINRDELVTAISLAGRNGDLAELDRLRRILETLQTPISLASVSTTNPNFGNNVYEGRDLTPADIGTNNAVIVVDDRMREWGVGVGSRLVVQIRENEYAFNVVGVVQDSLIQQDTLAEMMIPNGILGAVPPNFVLNSVQSAEGRTAEVQNAISQLPFFFTVDVRLLDSLISRLIDQFSTLPLLVGVLSLGAAGVIMANTVALATFERRRQIGVLKAIGLKRQRVMNIMLLENIIISLLGAVIGIIASAGLLAGLTWFGLDEMMILPSNSTPVVLGLVMVALMIGVVATLLSVRSAANERVMNVLRYE